MANLHWYLWVVKHYLDDQGVKGQYPMEAKAR